ncbi:MAG: tetratricopeptide repeat protein, partial [Streptosporangiales bacterium]
EGSRRPLVAGRFVDFYALLSVPADASTQAVRDAIIDQRRIWEPRQESGDPESRSVADDLIRDIDLAEFVLLDPTQRVEYDDEWRQQREGPAAEDFAVPANGHVGRHAEPRAEPRGRGRFDAPGAMPMDPADIQPAAGAGASGTRAGWGEAPQGENGRAHAPSPATVGWGDDPAVNGTSAGAGPDDRAEDDNLRQIKDLLARGDRSAAIHMAQQAIRQNDDSGAAWAVRAAAAAGLGNISAAIENYHQATRIEPDNPTYHYDLGRCYDETGDHERAFACYDAAARLAPHVTVYRAAVGNALIRTGRPRDAVAILEHVVSEAPTNQAYRGNLALAMHDTCVHLMTPLPDGRVCITTAEQARAVEGWMTRASALVGTGDDDELSADVAEKLELARLAQQRSWRPPASWWVLVPLVVVIAGGLALIAPWWTGVITLGVLVAGIVMLGLRPNWWHVARAVRRATAVPPTTPPSFETGTAEEYEYEERDSILP